MMVVIVWRAEEAGGTKAARSENKNSQFVGMRALELVGMAQTKSAKWLSLLVADAVDIEPVSCPKFPANREKNREFFKITTLRAAQTAN
jgi:hypothetical protein